MLIVRGGEEEASCWRERGGGKVETSPQSDGARQSHGCRHRGRRQEELAGQDGRGEGVQAVVGHPRGLPAQHPHPHRSGRIVLILVL